MKIIIYDIAASCSGALSILEDYYEQIIHYKDKNIEWHFIISTPQLKNAEKIFIHRYPYIKKSLLHRLFFDYLHLPLLLKRMRFDGVVSLQNVRMPSYSGSQIISLHNALPLYKCGYGVMASKSEVLKQKIINHQIRSSLKKAIAIFVPNKWMKQACVEKLAVNSENVFIIPMTVSGIFDEKCTQIKRRNVFFYPANAEPYKKHDVIVEACRLLKNKGIENYQIFLTAKGNENAYISRLKKIADDEELNIYFIGQQNRDTVYDYYRNGVLLFPSQIETDALPLIEARNTNSYILAANTLFAHDALNGYSNVQYHTLGNHTQLAKQIEKMMDGYYTLEIKKQEPNLQDEINRVDVIVKTFKKQILDAKNTRYVSEIKT